MQGEGYEALVIAVRQLVLRLRPEFVGMLRRVPGEAAHRQARMLLEEDLDVPALVDPPE